jgi:hypothetical protein
MKKRDLVGMTKIRVYAGTIGFEDRLNYVTTLENELADLVDDLYFELLLHEDEAINVLTSPSFPVFIGYFVPHTRAYLRPDELPKGVEQVGENRYGVPIYRYRNLTLEPFYVKVEEVKQC